MDDNSTKKKSKEKIIETAKNRFRIGVDADSENREKAIEDMKFRAGDQWPEQVKNARALDQRPCLTINKIPQNVHQITNDQRQNRPSIKVKPFDDYADVETAEILQGMIRSIENNSNADTAYDIAFDSSVTGGRGFIRVVTEYSSPESFDQDIKIKSIHNPHTVVLDPNYKEPDGSDANWGFLFDDIPKEDFKAQYPNAEIHSDTFNWASAEESDWFSEDNVRVAEYFEKEFKKEKLYLLPDGSTVLASDIKKSQIDISEEELKTLKSRDTQVPVIHWYKINGNEILEQTIWPSQWIPIVPIHGEELFVDGKRVFEGIIRHAKDPQRMYNYWATCETEAIALAPKTPYVGAEGQFEGFEDQWNNSHIKNYAFLQYKPTLLANGTPAPPPQKQHMEANVQAITQARMLSSDDLKTTTGIYDASLGNRSNETSGKAINRRTQQAQTGNFHFIDNLSRSIRHVGQILIDLLPKVYDTKRVVRILGEDDEETIIVINEMFQDKDGKNKKHDISKGKYDSTVTTGPSYASKRQEAVESMLDLSRSYPKALEVAGDLMVHHMDWPGAQEIAKRLKKTIPPEILGEDDDTQLPPQVKQQLDQMGGMIDQLTKQLAESQDKLDDKMMGIESKERIEMQKSENQLRIKQAELQAKYGANKEDMSVLANEILDLNERLNLIGFNEPINEDEIAENLEQEIAQENNLTGEMSPGITSEMLTE